jgi:hypothetical protein
MPKANFAAANQAIPITYGRDRLFGQAFVVHVDDTSKSLYTAMSFCEGQIAGFEKIIIDGVDALATGKAFEGVKNRGFETGDLTGWGGANQDGTVNVIVSRNGTYGCNIPAQAATAAQQESDRLTAPPEGTVMKFKVWASRNAVPTSLPDTDARIVIREAATVGGALSGSATVVTDAAALQSVAGFQQIEVTWTVPAGVAQYTISLEVDNTGTAVGSWDFDDFTAHIYDPSDDTKEIGIEVCAYVGSPTQKFDGLLASVLGGYVDDLPGLAYISMRTPAGATTGFPRLEAIVQGRLVYDPRKDDTAGALGPELTFTRAAGSATFRDWEGLYREVGVDEPRFDGARRVENLWTFTSDYSNAAYDKNGSTVAAVPTVLAHDGKTDVWELRSIGTGTGSVSLDYDFTFPANGKQTFSAEFKQGSSSIPVVLFQLIGLTSTSNYIYFDFTTGTVQGGGLSGFKDQWHVEMLHDGWYRISITVNGDSTAKACSMISYLAEAVSDTTIVRDTTQYMYFRNWQRENVIGQANTTQPSEYVESGATPGARTFNTDREGSVLVGSRIVQNEIQYSDDMTSGAWLANSGATRTPTTVTFTATSGSGVKQVMSGMNPKGVFVCSVLIWGDDPITFDLELVDNGDGSDSATTSVTVTPTPTLYFVVMDNTLSSTFSGSLGMFINRAASVAAGSVVNFSNWQVEEVTLHTDYFPNKYLPTTTVPVSETVTAYRSGESLPGGRGLIKEQAGTNAADYSNDFTDAGPGWGAWAGTSVTEVAGLFPGHSGWQHLDVAGANHSRAQVQGTFTNAQTDCLSFILENVDATLTDVGIRDATAAAWVNLIRLNWADLTLNQQFGINGGYEVEDLGTGPNGGKLIRLIVTAVGTAAGTGATGNQRVIYSYPCGGPTNTDTVIIHHCQFETARSQASTPIITTDATDVTRQSESINTTDTTWYDATKGTWYARASVIGDNSPTQGNIFSMHDGASAERISMYIPATDNAGFYMRDTGTGAQVNLQHTDTFLNNRQHCLAATLSAAGSDFYVDGVVLSDTTVTAMPVVDELAIGQLTSAASEPMDGYIQDVRYYNVIQDATWLKTASLGGIGDGDYNNDPSLTMCFNFARDMTLQGVGSVGGVGSHRADDSTTWEYSANPTLAFRDMVDNFTSWDILDEGVVANAIENDMAFSGNRRREIGLSLGRVNTVDSWVKGMRAYMGAFLNWEGGKIRVIPNRPDVEAPGAVNLDRVAGTWVDVGNQTELDFDGTESYTVEVTFRIDPGAAGNTQVLVNKKTTPQGADAGYSIHFNFLDELVFQLHDGTNGVSYTDTTTSYVEGVWYCIAMVVDQANNELTPYLNGVPLAAATNISTITTTANAASFRIGATSGGTDLFKGDIDEVRVWNDVRTPAEILANCTDEIRNPEGDTSLVGYWKLNEGSSETVGADSSGNRNPATLAGNATFVNGNAQIIPDGVAMHITVDDIVKDSLDLKRRSLRSVPNSVAIDYEDSSGTRWFTARTQADSPRVTSGDEARRLSRVSLPGIHNASQAQREATERLNWYLTDLECTLAMFDEGWKLTHGSIVAVTHPIGLDAKLFRVRQTSGESGRWVVDLTEYDPAIYSNVVVADPTIPDTSLGDPLNPPTVTNLVLAEELFNYKTGVTGSRVRVTWDASGFPFLSQYLVEAYVGGAKVWQTFTGANDIVSPPVEEIVDALGTPTDYEVRVYVQSPFATGAAAIDNVQIDGKFAIPSDPTGAAAVQTFADGVKLTWVAAVDIDIWRYEVRRGTTSDTWASATSLVFVDGLEFSETGLALGTHRYFIKAIDSVKQESTNAAFVDVTLSAPTAVTGLFGFEVASEVRLNWTAVTGEFAERYRIAYSDIPETFETTLDVVDTTRFSTKDVPEGTFTFKAYTQDKVGNEAATPATVDIEVTSDADAFLADSYDFVTPTLTNMVEWDIRTDDLAYYVTNMGDAFAVSPTDFVASDPLANYHSTGASEWLSETKDFGLLLTGSWNLTHDTTSLQGNVTIALELSTDDVTYSSFGGSAKGEFRYARVRISTDASPGTATSFVKSPIMNLKINVVPLEESGEATSSPNAGVGKTINLTREYTALKEITTQPKNTIASGSAVTSIVDNIVIGPNTAVQTNTTRYLDGGDIAAFDFGATQDWAIGLWMKHTGGTQAQKIVCGKRTGTAAGWSLVFNETDENVSLIIDDGTNQVTSTIVDGCPNDGLWHHVAFSVDRTGDLITRIQEGVLDGTTSIATVTGSLSSGATAFRIFADNTGAAHWNNGMVDQLVVYDATRTPAQFLANKDIALDMTVTQTNLIAYWLMDGTVGANVGTLTDETVNAYTLTPTGTGNAVFVDPGAAGNVVQKINSFDVFIFDTFGQQLAEQFQWKWKAV